MYRYVLVVVNEVMLAINYENKITHFENRKISINTFGNEDSVTKTIDAIPLKFVLKDKIIQIECLCTSLICSDIVNQGIMSVSSSYPHFSLAD